LLIGKQGRYNAPASIVGNGMPSAYEFP